MASLNSSGFAKKQFFKFTGPPENWLSAINFMTWGLEEKYRNRWQQILPGDIFLMHSTSTNTVVKGAISSIIGFGVVGSNLREKDSPLWLQEFETKTNRWPLLVPFSEIYLFSSYFQTNDAIAPTFQNLDLVAGICQTFLREAIPLSRINGFPQMGSFSSVRQEIVTEIFQQAAELYVIGSNVQSHANSQYIPSPLLPIEYVSDAVRYGTSLQTLEEVKKKTHVSKKGTFTKDPTLLERADNAHQDTLQKLLDLFRGQEYQTYFNKHVDLYATNGNLAYLIEVKSNENKNFLPQARKGIVQLFEYEYFEIKKFNESAKSQPKHLFKNLTFSQQPTDMGYIDFVNSLHLGVSHFETGELIAAGENFGLDLIKS